MPETKTLERAKKDQAEGKSPSTQAGEFVREEVEHIREGKHGARSTKQAIAIGLSKARRAGVKLPAPGRGTSRTTRRKAAADARKGRAGKAGKASRPSARRSRATERALKKEGRSAGSRAALSRQARSAAAKRGAASRSASARAAARTRAARGSRSRRR